MVMVKTAGTDAAHESDVKAGAVFAGRYRIVRPLGEGDRKRTYLAEDTVLGRKVALALIKEAAEGAPSGAMQEWRALAQTGNNENIVTLHDRGSAEGIDYLVFDYLAGGTLREYFRKRADRDRPFSADEVMKLGRQLARALSHVHKHGLIHRDVAPENVWLDERTEARLGDFDSVIDRDAPQDDAQPVTTEEYAAPEQAAGGHVDERSDLYSLGAVLYEAATYQRPTRTGDSETARSLAALRPDLPRKLTAVICRLLAELPGNRPASAEEILDALKPARGPLGSDEAWTHTLPFPLASVLWHYLAEPQAADQVSYLLKFFEGLAQFAATVQLSACLADRAFFDAHKSAWFGADRAGRSLDLQRATFGTWVELSERLAATGRQMLADYGDEADFYLRLFSASDTGLIEALNNRDLDRILRHARQRRNDWSGHGGVVGPRQQAERLKDLEELLARTRRLFGWSFETWTLLRPGPMTLAHGEFDITATILTGTNAAFRKKHLQLSYPLDAESLYLLNDGSSQALALVPLIRFIPDSNTGEDACYFYNRLEGEQVRWVSYHYCGEPERILSDADVVKCLSSLTP
jgi:hypothetical protein